MQEGESLPASEQQSEKSEVESSRRILLVDDEKLVRTALLRTIQMFDRAAKIIDVSSVAEALSEIQGGFEPDVIFSDMDMPDASGREFLKELIATKRLDLAKRLCFVSGGNNKEELQAILKEVGDKGVALEKPFQKESILEAIRSIVGGAFGTKV